MILFMVKPDGQTFVVNGILSFSYDELLPFYDYLFVDSTDLNPFLEKWLYRTKNEVNSDNVYSYQIPKDLFSSVELRF